MKKTRVITISGIAIAIIIAVIFFIYGPSRFSPASLPPPPDPAFSKYISAFSTGVMPTDQKIVVQLAFEYIDSTKINTLIEQDIFRIKPGIDGNAYWKDRRTIEFRPDEKLPHDKKFSVDFYLSKLLDVPSEYKTFSFGFVTMKQAAELSLNNIEAYYKNNQPLLRIKGKVNTADAADPEEVSKILSLKSLPEHGKVDWQHNNNMREHNFTINDIKRESNAFSIELSWNADNLDTKDKGSELIELPKTGELELINSLVSQSPDPFISLQFSEPLDANQNINGLVHIDGISNVQTRINNNEIRIYFSSRPDGEKILFAETAIRAANGNRLKERVVMPFQFENIKPEVKFIGKGVIIPSSSGLLLPFEAVNLAAVDISIVRIFEDNVNQFFQNNQFDGNNQIKRVGRIIAKKTISLMSAGVTNRNTWNRYSVDLGEIIMAEPGAIYQVIIDFKKDYSAYPCDNGEDTEQEQKSILTYIEEDWQLVSDDVDYYGSYDEYNYYYNYNWSERDDPCTDSYYHNKSVRKNIFASDFGIITKKDPDGTINVFITDLATTKPVSGVDIELYNFQQQLIESVITNNKGTATITPRNNAYLLIAKKGEQRGYLRLDDGNSLSLSMFDVDGERVQSGTKGFIYSERGVWRPGDTLFLTLILEDMQERIPQGHPVVFELYNPYGQLVYSKVNKKGLNGFYHFKVPTSEEDITGNWSSVFKIGGREFRKSLRIETIMPNRLRIKIDFNDESIKAFDTKPISLHSEWLHGAVARNLKAEVKVTLSEAKTTFKDYRDYTFDDPSRPFHSETHTVFSGRLDANGKASFNPNISITSNAPGMLRAGFETKIFEEGGAFSIDRTSIPYLPYNSFAGVKTPEGKGFSGILYTDSIHQINLINVDANGNPLKNGRLKVDVYKIDWRWWWDSSDEYLGDFSSSSYKRPVQTKTLDAIDGKASFPFQINYPEWGRYLILATDLKSGHRTGKTILIDWPSWYGARSDGPQEAANMLNFTTDKEKYQTGEDIKFSFPSSDEGRALVSFENGSGVFKTIWIESKSGTTNFSVKATPDMAPNFYAHISLIQPHAQTKNDLPIRLYGVVPILVENPNTILKPVINMPESLSPGEMVNINIGEENGKAMTYTVAMVDEGLLDLTRFKTPDPWNHFYAKEALGVKTWDMYDYVLGAFGSEFARLLSIGGDGEIDVPAAGEKATRFKPVVKFFGPYELQKGKSMQHSFTMPQYVGSVRTMVIAGNNGAYGSAEKATPVKQSLMILGTLPRVLGPGEKVKLPVNVFVSDDNINNVSITVETNDLLKLKDSNTQNLNIKNSEDQTVFFDIITAEKTGVAKVKIKAKSDKHSAVYDIELYVRNPNPEVTKVESFIIEEGQNGETAYQAFGIEGTNSATLEISSIPPINLEKRLKFLTRYPHGCSEQIVSGAFPQLFLGNLVHLEQEEQERIKENIISVINRVNSRMLSNGGISLWPGSSYADDWTTSYAGHFMLEANEKGYSIPDGFISNWRSFQSQVAKRWMPETTFMGSHLMQAYRLYTLALSGAPEMGAMNRMREMPNLSNKAKWRLAAAYYLAGQTEAAESLIDNISADIEPYNQTGYTYGSNQRDEAMIIETLTLLDRKSDAAPLVKELSEELASNYYFSTQTTSFALLAISKFHGEKQASSEIDFFWKTDASNEKQVTTEALLWQSEIPVDNLERETKISVKNNSDNTLFGRTILTGTPAVGSETSSENNLTMKVSYTDTKGNFINAASIKQGTTFIAEVTIGNPGARGDYSQLALTQIFPSGWEISNVRMDESADAIQVDTPEYQDIRDDRVYTYFNLPANKSKTFRIMLNATYEGEYYLPAFHVEAMYDPSIYAGSIGRWVKVIK